VGLFFEMDVALAGRDSPWRTYLRMLTAVRCSSSRRCGFRGRGQALPLYGRARQGSGGVTFRHAPLADHPGPGRWSATFIPGAGAAALSSAADGVRELSLEARLTHTNSIHLITP
jgi:hypothetical protein